MRTELYLQIPKPCHENWDAMTPVDQGRFCASCSKEVVDFSLLSDAEVLNFFKRSTGNTCGRFNEEQLQRPFHETKIEKKKGWKWAMASITSLIMISKSNAQKKEVCNPLLGKVKMEQPRNPLKDKTTVKMMVDTVKLPAIQLQPLLQGEVVITSPGRKIKIEGMVVDEKNQPIESAAIHTDNEAVIGYTDQNGHFAVTTYARGNKFPISFRSLGFKDDNSVIDLQEDEVQVKVYMKPNIIVLPEVSVTSFVARRIKGMVGSVVSCTKITTNDTVAAVIRNVLDIARIAGNPLKVYPNPVLKNSMVYLSIKEAGNYQVHLFDNTSRLLQAQENTTTVKQQPVDLSLPPGMASGIYYIRLINMKTKKSYVEKLIVQ